MVGGRWRVFLGDVEILSSLDEAQLHVAFSLEAKAWRAG